MKKEEWENIYNILNDILSDFLLDSSAYKNGRNKKIREDAERKLNNAIRLAESQIRKNPEVYSLLTGDGNDDFGRTMFMDEFRQKRYFDYEMAGLLRKIKEKIQELS